MHTFTIRAKKNSSYVVNGVATYTDAEGKEQTTSGATFRLCRCGQSSNKPFCDETHHKIGFEAPEIMLYIKE